MSKEKYLKHKKWEEEQKEKKGSLKKPITCKGKKEHQFVLSIPKYYILTTPMTTEQVNIFYELEERYCAFMRGQSEAYERIGLKKYSSPGICYFYKCSICGKEKNEYKR